MLNLNNIIFATSLAGLGSPQSDTFSVAVSGNIAAFAGLIRVAQLTLERPNSIHEVQFRLTGLETDWHLLEGVYFYTHPSLNWGMTTRTYIQDGVIYVSNFITNFTAGVLALPSFTVDCKATAYDAPF